MAEKQWKIIGTFSATVNADTKEEALSKHRYRRFEHKSENVTDVCEFERLIDWNKGKRYMVSPETGKIVNKSHCSEKISMLEAVELLNTQYELLRNLKKELQRIYDTATANKTIEILEKYYDKLLSDGSDEIKDAKRLAVLDCIEELEMFKDEI